MISGTTSCSENAFATFDCASHVQIIAIITHTDIIIMVDLFSWIFFLKDSLTFTGILILNLF